MNSRDILYAMTSIDNKYILAAQKKIGYDPEVSPRSQAVVKRHNSIRRTIALIAAVIILMSVCFTTALAVSPEFREMVFTFLGIIEDKPASNPVAESIPAETTKPDERTLLQNLIDDYMSIKKADFQSETHIDMSQFYIPELRDTLEAQLSWKVFRFEKYVRLSIVETLLWEKIEYTIHDMQINGTTANVRVMETYEYELAAADGKISSRGTELIITCEMIDGEWFISGIETDNDLIEGHVAGYKAEELAELAGYSK